MQGPGHAFHEGLLEGGPGGAQRGGTAAALFSLLVGAGLLVALLPAGGAGGRPQERAITAWQHLQQPARAQQLLRLARPKQFAQPPGAGQLAQQTRVWQPAQPSGNREFIRPAAVATPDDVATEVAKKSPDPAYQKSLVFGALGQGSDEAARAELGLALPNLEGVSPTKDPAFSGLLTGKWAVKHTGGVAKGPVDSPTREIALLMYAAGFGPGNAALSLAKRLPDNLVEVKTLSLDITAPTDGMPGESRARLEVRLLNGQTDANVELLCELQADGPAKLIETGKEVSINGGAPVSIPQQVRYVRDLFVTYLDGELLVVRDATGSPDVLQRESPPPAGEEVLTPVVEPGTP